MDDARPTRGKWRFRKTEMKNHLQLPSSKFIQNFVKIRFLIK